MTYRHTALQSKRFKCVNSSIWFILSKGLRWIRNYDKEGHITLTGDVTACVCVILSVMSDSLWPHELYPVRFLCPWNSPVKNTGIGSHCLLQGIFLAQGLNLCLLHCRQILYHLNHQRIPNVIAYLMIKSHIILLFTCNSDDYYYVSIRIR